MTRTRAQGTQRLISLRRDDLEARFPGLVDPDALARVLPLVQRSSCARAVRQLDGWLAEIEPIRGSTRSSATVLSG